MSRKTEGSCFNGLLISYTNTSICSFTEPGVAETEYEDGLKYSHPSTALTSPFCLRSSPVSSQGHPALQPSLPLPMDFPNLVFWQAFLETLCFYVRFTWIEGVWDDSYSFHFLVFLSPNHLNSSMYWVKLNSRKTCWSILGNQQKPFLLWTWEVFDQNRISDLWQYHILISSL